MLAKHGSRTDIDNDPQRASIAAEPVKFKGQTIAITTSVGVAQITPDELAASDSMAAALARADQALYQSKKNGHTGSLWSPRTSDS